MKINVFVAGTPKPQPRPRRAGNRKGVYTPDTAKDWKMAILAAMVGQNHMVDGPVRCKLTFLMPRPKRLYRKKDDMFEIPHTTKPDIDNLMKAVYDAMTQAGVWKDDSVVYMSESRKCYHAKDGQPGVWIEVESDA